MTETPDAKPPQPAPRFASQGWRFAMLVALTVLMVVPLILVSFVIQDRAQYQRQAVYEVSQQWGGEIFLTGPVMVIPVEVERTRAVKDEDGVRRTETYVERSDPIVLMPEQLDISAGSASEVRSRGIFEVPVYSADLSMSFGFETDRVPSVVRPRETVLWTKAELTIALPATRSFTGATVLRAGPREFDLEPGSPVGNGRGIRAAIGDPRNLAEMSLDIGLNGAQWLGFTPTGRLTRVEMTSDWPHPSFSGAFLPKTREVNDNGFTAVWEVPHLARDIPQVSRSLHFEDAAFGVRFYNPVDFYQKVERAAKYGILFIALTFLTVFLCERYAPRPVHPAQMVLIGVAQCVFFLLLLSFSEQIGFSLAYLASGAATVGLIGIYGRTGLGLGRKVWTLIGALTVLYGVLYMILRSTDYALLAGSILAFVAVAVAMLATRSESWYPDRRASAGTA